MKHVFPIMCIFFSMTLFVFSPIYVEAGVKAVSSSSKNSLTKSFGGKIYMANIPMVTCNGSGSAIVMSSNINAVLDTVKSVQKSKSEEEGKSTAKSLYGMIPTYTTNASKQPQARKQILGRENAIPDFSTCYIPVGPYRVPFPVLKTTDNYNVSK